jgi:NAD(P)-dependent dehydrogenase (short-subunit alcohol dehydrogenase family)
MVRKLSNSVIVITGASSGIGRATAHAFARKGASLALGARRQGSLERAGEECRKLGADVAVVPLDVTSEASVRHLCATAIDRFGRVDVWVNNASVTVWGRLDDIPIEDFRRVVDVNLFGYVHGARAVLPVFRRQGSGVLVNVGSLVSRLSEPYVAPYVVSKHGVRGLGAAIRQELAVEGVKGVQVSTVMPATIDTPFFEHSGNYTGRAAKAMPPVYTPERVARTIVNCARFPRREVFVGNVARMMVQQHKVMPGITERVMAEMTNRQHLYRDRPTPATSGNVHEPLGDDDGVHGSWHGRRRTAVRRLATVGLAAAGVALARRDRSA